MEEKLYPRRWAILAALFLCLVTLQFSFIVPGGAALAVMMRYGIDGTLFSMIMSVPYFAGIVFGIFLGTLADRIGVEGHGRQLHHRAHRRCLARPVGHELHHVLPGFVGHGRCHSRP